MLGMIVVDAAEAFACPMRAHTFGLSGGISRQAIERHADDCDRYCAEGEAAQQVSALKEQLAGVESAAKAHNVQLQMAAEDAGARAGEQLQLELNAAGKALSPEECALTHLRSEELRMLVLRLLNAV